MPNPRQPAIARRTLAIVFAATTIFSAHHASAQSDYQPSPENLEARREFQNMKFGMFIHWGVYSVLGDGEWVFHDRKLTLDGYNRLPSFFDPEKFDAAAWVALAKAAGMKYITITSRHHDGFAMFDSKVSDWNIVQRTPYKRDPLKMLADECHRQGIKLFFYYSQLDWHNPDYYPRGATNWPNGRPDHGDWNTYLDTYMDGQLRELLTNYGPIGGIWFDGMWDKPDADWHLQKTYATHSPVATRHPHHSQPSSNSQARRRRPNFRARSPRTKYRRLQYQLRQQSASARKFRHPQRLLGIQHRRRQLQKCGRPGTKTGASRRQQFQPAAQHWPHAQRSDPGRICHTPARRRRVALQIRRFDLWHSRRTDRARRLGRHHAEG